MFVLIQDTLVFWQDPGEGVGLFVPIQTFLFEMFCASHRIVGEPNETVLEVKSNPSSPYKSILGVSCSPDRTNRARCQMQNKRIVTHMPHNRYRTLSFKCPLDFDRAD